MAWMSLRLREITLDGRLTDWFARISADCPKRKANQFSDWCGIHSPDLVRLARGERHE
jgi:hypothetical protein